METDTVTIDQFIKDNNISLDVIRHHENPSMPESRDMDHWKVTLKRGRKRMTLYFSKGYGHHGEQPETDEVLDCLASDAAGIENAGSLEDWCGEYGYDADSRTAERIYKTCQHQAGRLRRFLGDEYETLLWDTERC